MLLTQNDPFRDLDMLFRRLGTRSVGTDNTMAMDAYRRGSDVWVHVDMPGVSADQVDINVERGVLTITAERSWPREEGDQLYLNERQTGAFRRQVHLGDSLDVDGIEADFANGVLTLRIPISERAQPKRIEIKARQAAIDTDVAAGSS
ncbi:MAG: Hsp20/alpha crystallin family protein [Acidimicrobiia bacterium]|nr:Hsp20/alpha crystallin family protein [Acidimicrobiia bacterium]